jgi:hypothetical protein
VAALAILAVILFLVPAVAPPPDVTIQQFDWTIVQGTWVLDNHTKSWFVEQYINQSGELWGYPFEVPAHGTFNVSLVLVVYAPFDVPLCNVTVNPPLQVVSTYPTLPARMDGGEDNLLQIALSVDASSGATVSGLGVVDALGCNLPP